MARFLEGTVSLDELVGVIRAVSAEHAQRLLYSWCLQMYETAYQYVGRKLVRNDGSSKSWFTEELRSLRKTVDRLRSAIVIADSDPLVSPEERKRLWDEHNEWNQQYLREYRKQKSLEELRVNSELEDAETRGDLRLFWRRVKRMKGFYKRSCTAQAVYDESGQLITDPVEVLQHWRAFYLKTGTVRDDAEEKIQQDNPFDSAFREIIEKKVAELALRREYNPELDELITRAELDKAILKLKRNTAAGPDLIPNSFLRAMGPIAREALLQLFNRIWLSGKWPDDWREGVVVPLFKSGLRANIADYRPITLTSCVAKLFETILLQRLTDWTEALQKITDLQGGFRPGRSTLEQIFTLHEITAMRAEAKDSTYLAFLDCKRAYDRCWRSGLAERMWSIGIKGRMWDIIQDMLASVSRRVVIGGQESEPFDLSVGVPQGAVLSPLLYSIFIQGLSDMLLAEGFGLIICGVKVPVLLYADDIVLLADDKDQLQSMLDAVSRYAAQWQFRFNCKKCNVVVVSSNKEERQDAADENWTIGDGPIAVSNEYKYLGMEMGKIGRGQWNSFLTRVEKRAQDKVHQLLHAACGKRPLKLKTAVHLFKTLVRPVMEYGDAIWAGMASKTALDDLERIQCKFGRAILRCPGAAAEFVRSELGLATMRSRVNCASMRFFGKLCSMSRSRLTAKIFRLRCRQVDDGHGLNSWCLGMKRMLQDYGLGRAWQNRLVTDTWKSDSAAAVQQREREISAVEVKKMSSLRDYPQLKPSHGLEQWMERTLRHPGVRIRLQLRSDTAPLMDRVGARAKIPKNMRVCLLCGSNAVEDVRHFICVCPRYAELRQQSLDRLQQLVTGTASSELRDALQVRDNDSLMKLFLGSAILKGLPSDIRVKADGIMLNGLKLAWRKRELIWKIVCKDNDPWKLR